MFKNWLMAIGAVAIPVAVWAATAFARDQTPPEAEDQLIM